jgi:metallo-beta-lactamase class B
MSVSLALIAAAQLLPVTVPFGRPRQIEQARAPIERAGPRWVRACGSSTDWNQPAPPVRIHANTYYVGTCGIAAILVTGSAGHVLIDAGTEKGADLIAANIRSLGFKVEDIRFLLHSHEHLDHVGGMSRLKQLSRAQLLASPTAARVFATGAPTADDPQAGMHKPFPAVPADLFIADGHEVRLGDLMLKAIATPGHTAGALSWRWVSCDGGVCRTIVYADSLSPVSRDDYRFSDHLAALAAFRASIAKIAASECDILVTPHPSASGLGERFGAGKPLLDPDGCKTYAAKLTANLDKRLAEEAARK